MGETIYVPCPPFFESRLIDLDKFDGLHPQAQIEAVVEAIGETMNIHMRVVNVLERDTNPRGRNVFVNIVPKYAHDPLLHRGMLDTVASQPQKEDRRTALMYAAMESAKDDAPA